MYEDAINKDIKNEDNWCYDDVITIISWVSIGRKKIREMELIVDYNRLFMRQVTFYNLLFSSASGTVGVATIENASLLRETRFWCNLAVVIASFLVTILTGALKICQVQENLELAIKYKQDWISFSAEIASEIQLPDKHRRESQFIINKNRAKYLELLKLDIEVPTRVAKQMKHMIESEQNSFKLLGHRSETDGSSLVDILANIIDYEHLKLNEKFEEDEDSDSEVIEDNKKIVNETELRKRALKIDQKKVDVRASAMSPKRDTRDERERLITRVARREVERDSDDTLSLEDKDKYSEREEQHTRAETRIARGMRRNDNSDDDIENQNRKNYK
jgi:hypothetical protein